MRIGRSKPIIWILIALLVIIAVPSLVFADEDASEARLNYLALGDSLAEGYTPYPQIVDGVSVPVFDNGYPDFIAQKLDDDGRLAYFEQRYAVSGSTSAALLNAILTDFHRDLPNDPDTIGIRESISKADIITLDVGANDLLTLMRNPDGPNLRPEAVRALLTQLSVNLTGVVTEIKTLNPEAKVYLMGYYNAFPYMPIDQQEQIGSVIEAVNGVIQNTALAAGAAYVPTYEAIDKHPELYIPNPENIHLSQQGYRAIAKEFWRYIKADLE